MKKTYMKPALDVVKIQTTGMIAGSPARATGLDGVTDGEYTGGAIDW